MSTILFVCSVPSGQICERFAPEGGCLFLMPTPKMFSTEVLIRGLLFAIQQFCLATGLILWYSDIAEEQQSEKRQQAVLKHVPLGLSAEGTGPLQALCKSHVTKFHVTTHPLGQVTEMQQEPQAFITRFNQSCTRAVVAAFKPKLLPHHF